MLYNRLYTFLRSQVRQLLSEDPRNSEYADMEKELKEVTHSYGCYFNHLIVVFV